MQWMNREQTEVAMGSVEAEYRDRLASNREELKRLNAMARQEKDNKLKKLRRWLEVIDARVPVLENERVPASTP